MSNDMLRKASLLFYQRDCCYLCGGLMQRRRRKNNKTLWRTTEHIMPRSLGGSPRGANVAMAHMGCNIKKGNRMPYACEIFLGQVLAMRVQAVHSASARSMISTAGGGQ
jgi:hypothetical protein